MNIEEVPRNLEFVESFHNNSDMPEAPYFEDMSPLQLVEKIIACIEAIEEPKERRWPLQDLGLELDATSEDVQRAVALRVENYLVKYDELKEMLPRRIEMAERWMKENTLSPSQNIREVPVLLYDKVLALTRPDDRRTAVSLAAFRPDMNIIVMNTSAVETELAHEYGHAASFSVADQRVGWARIDERGNPMNGQDNRWLDEGCAISVEMATAGITLEEYRQKNPQYAMYYALTQSLREQIGMSEQDLMHAYLSEGTKRQQFDDKVVQRYGCTVFELADILVGDYAFEAKMHSILNGEPVELKDPGERADPGLLEKYAWLAATFPHITVR